MTRRGYQEKKNAYSGQLLPNFFIIGEPRSGTTSLHDLLNQHPDIFMSPVKEPHYFSRLEFPSPEDGILRITRDKQQYLDLFAEAKGYSLRGESSTYYLSDPHSPKLIKQAVPNVKLIAVLRNPIERAYSHYLLYDRRGRQQKTFYETIQHNTKTPEAEQKLVYNLVELGRYHKHIANYLRHFDKKQLLVIKLSDLQQRPGKTLDKIFQFLGAQSGHSAHITTDKPQNTYAKPRNKFVDSLLSNKTVTNIGVRAIPRPLLQKLRNDVLLKKDQKPPLDEASKQLLHELYRPEMAKLDKLLGRNLALL